LSSDSGLTDPGLFIQAPLLISISSSSQCSPTHTTHRYPSKPPQNSSVPLPPRPPPPIPRRASRETTANRTKTQRKARQRAVSEEIGFVPTDPYVLDHFAAILIHTVFALSDSISSHEKKCHYLECLEHYVLYLHEQLRLVQIPPLALERVSTYRGLSSRSIRTLLVYMQNVNKALHQNILAEEQIVGIHSISSPCHCVYVCHSSWICQPMSRPLTAQVSLSEAPLLTLSPHHCPIRYSPVFCIVMCHNVRMPDASKWFSSTTTPFLRRLGFQLTSSAVVVRFVLILMVSCAFAALCVHASMPTWHVCLVFKAIQPNYATSHMPSIKNHACTTIVVSSNRLAGVQCRRCFCLISRLIRITIRCIR